MEAAGAPASAGRSAKHRAAVETAWRGAANQMAATLACERFEGRDKPMRVVGRWKRLPAAVPAPGTLEGPPGPKDSLLRPPSRPGPMIRSASMSNRTLRTGSEGKSGGSRGKPQGLEFG
jgi:hypothetical protein